MSIDKMVGALAQKIRRWLQRRYKLKRLRKRLHWWKYHGHFFYNERYVDEVVEGREREIAEITGEAPTKEK